MTPLRRPAWLCGLAAVGVSAGLAVAPGVAAAGPRVVLSNETTSTRWANTRLYASVRVFPSPTSRRITGLRFRTEDRLPEVYLVLASRRLRGYLWYEIRLPMRPNGRVGWVRAEALRFPGLVHTRLIIDRHRLTASLYSSGRRIWFSRVGVGKWSTPTPAGRFWIREKFPVPGGGSFGPYAFGTSAYSNTLTDWFGGGVIGIHGTDQPGLIPGRPSHGCIRIPNPAILRLARLMPVGTALLIL